MRFATKLLASAAALAFMSASAFAADLYVPIEEPFIPEVASLSWTGAYVGVHAGYGWGEAEWTTEDGPPDAGEFEMDGWLAGVQAGYNMNLDGIVIGVEGDVAWADINGTQSIEDVDIEASVNWLATLRGRIGFAADAFLVYGTAGVAFAGTDSSVTASDVDLGSDGNTHTGWVAGLGVETMVTDNLSLKAEYLYHDFGTEAYTYDETGPVDAEGSFNVQTVKLGLNLHF